MPRELLIKVVPGDKLSKSLKNTTVVPNSVLELGIPIGPKMTWIVLWSHCYSGHANYCWPSQERIAAMVGCSVRSIYTHLEALEKLGLIVRTLHGDRGCTGYYMYVPAPEDTE